MKNIKKLSLAIAAMLSFSAYAESNDNQKFYVGIGIAKTVLSDYDYDYDEVNFKLMGGMKITDNFSAEVQWVDIKNGNLLSEIAEGVNADIKGKSLVITGLYFFANSSGFKPFVKLGMHKWDFDANLSDSGIVTNYKTKGTDLFSGIGVDFANDGFTTRVEYEHYKFGFNTSDTKMKGFGVSVIAGF